MRNNWTEDLVYWAIGAMGAVVVGGTALAGGLALLDFCKERQAFPAIVSCERMRQDTATVQVR